jgi:hypothetical protein
MKVKKINDYSVKKAEQTNRSWFAFRITQDCIYFRYEKGKFELLGFLRPIILIKKYRG